jgi:hypothetical protein
MTGDFLLGRVGSACEAERAEGAEGAEGGVAAVLRELLALEEGWKGRAEPDKRALSAAGAADSGSREAGEESSTSIGSSAVSVLVSTGSSIALTSSTMGVMLEKASMRRWTISR